MTEERHMTAREIANKIANLNVEYNITKKSKIATKEYKDKYIPELKKEYHKLENELNTRFINKEILKDKIEQLKESSKDFECCIEVLNEILKFIK